MDELRLLINGFQLSQAVHAAVTLGVFEAVADGPRTSVELAATVDAHEPSLRRLLRALASAGLLDERPGHVYGLTPLGTRLTSGDARSLAAWAAYVGRPSNWQSWGNLVHTVRTGENAFQHLHGVDIWEYRRSHPAEGAVFDAAMVAQTRAVNRALLDAYDFGGYAVVADIGGGHGALLAAILQRHERARGILFDQPQVVEGAGAFLEAEGVADRCQVVGGDFFEAVPGGADAYLLKSIIHDWLEPEAARILEVCRNALPADGHVILVERVVEAPNQGLATNLVDLQMLVVAGGRERTVDEFAALFESAGLRLAGVTPTPSGFSVLEALPTDRAPR